MSTILTKYSSKEPPSADVRGGIRSVTRSDTLNSDIITESGGGLERALVIDRLVRVADNESVINYNSDKLQLIYQQISWTTEMLAYGLFSFFLGLFLIGAQFNF